MIPTRTTTCLMLLALVGAAARADDKKSAAAPGSGGGMPMPTVAPEWEAFTKGMDGHWKCESVIPAGSMGPGSPEMKVQVATSLKKEFGGFWLVGNYESKKTATTPSMKGTFALGSPDGKTLVSTQMNAMGGSVYAIGPLAPDGGTTTGDAFMMGTKVKARETLRRKSDKELLHKLEIDAGKGFMLINDDTCKK